MRVKIEDRVFDAMDEFYDASMTKHPLLSLETVLSKEKRMIADLKQLEFCAESMAPARFRQDWKRNGYLDFMTEGFHFGFRIEELPSGERVVVIYDACPDLLFHD